MHKETLDKLTNAAINKINLLNTSKVKYWYLLRLQDFM